MSRRTLAFGVCCTVIACAGGGFSQEAARWASLKGRVVLEGELPEVKSFEKQIREHFQSQVFLRGDKEHLLDPTWKVDAKSRGVANVVVYFEHSKSGNSLPIHSDDKKRSEKVVLDTPGCAYVPHIVALYPQWQTGEDKEATGQQFFVSCSMKDVPGFYFRFEVNASRNEPVSGMMASGQKSQVFLKPQASPIVVSDALRRWMKAYVWVFGHPYFAVTKSDGTFEMPRVPVGAKVKLIAWHEARGKFHTETLAIDEKGNSVAIKLTAAP